MRANYTRTAIDDQIVVDRAKLREMVKQRAQALRMRTTSFNSMISESAIQGPHYLTGKLQGEKEAVRIAPGVVSMLERYGIKRDEIEFHADEKLPPIDLSAAGWSGQLKAQLKKKAQGLGMSYTALARKLGQECGKGEDYIRGRVRDERPIPADGIEILKKYGIEIDGFKTSEHEPVQIEMEAAPEQDKEPHSDKNASNNAAHGELYGLSFAISMLCIEFIGIMRSAIREEVLKALMDNENGSTEK